MAVPDVGADPRAVALAVTSRHRRRALTGLCGCSPTNDHHHRDAILWSPDHLVDALATAGLIPEAVPPPERAAS